MMEKIENRFKNPRVRKRLFKNYDEDLLKNNTNNNITTTDETDCDEGSEDTEITPKTTENDRDLLKNIYHKNVGEDCSYENVSTDASDYTPSRQDHNHASTPSSSLGGDSECIEAFQLKISRSPSVISNVSTLLSQIDFVASSFEIFKADSLDCNTPKTKNDTKSTEHFNLVVKMLKPDCASDFLTTKSSVNGSPGGVVTNAAEAMQERSLNTSLHPTHLSQISDRKLDLQDTEFDTTLKPVGIITDSDSDSDQTLCCSIERHLDNETNKLLCSPVDANLLRKNKLPPSSFIEPYTVNEETRDNEPAHVLKPSSSTELPYYYNDIAETNSHIIEVAINIEPINEEEESITETAKKLKRKRKLDVQNWKCNKNKTLKNLGLPYTSKRSKKDYPAKTLKPECNCKKKCGERFTPEKRKDIFNKYYKLGNHEHQWQFIFRNVEVEDIKRTTLNRKCNRNQTLKYYFLDGEDKVQVCKKFFLNTLNISDTVIFTALGKVKIEKSLLDGRGHHNNRPHKTNSLTEESVIKHIKLFPTIEAHYVRKDSQKLYLQEDLNISKMYRLYNEWFATQDFDFGKANSRQYRKIFNTTFNYSFFKPKKDMCPTCTCYLQADEEKKIILQSHYDKHIANKDIVRDIKNTEKESTTESKTVAIFDLEKVLYIPRSDVSVFYYKRKYPVYNFTVFDAGRKLGYCYMWHMKIAKRGAIEIGSCLLKFFKNEHDRAVTDISLYSDGCPGQNKNRFLFALHLYAATKFNLTITHRFFESGHSQNEGDSMHACIERELKKNKVLYTPEQIYAVAMNAKVTGEKYKVIEMDQCDFFDIKRLIEGRNWTHDTNGNKIAWSNIMEVVACHTHEDILKFRYSFTEDYNELNTRLLPTRSVRAPRGARVRGGRTPSRGVRIRGRQALNVADTLTTEIPTIPDLQRAYNQPFPVPKPLHSDLLSLCRNDDIPRHYHVFYRSLNCDNDEGTEANAFENDVVSIN